MSQSKNLKQQIFWIFGLILVLVLLAVAFCFRAQIQDLARVMRFKPTAEISALVDKIELTERGKFLFYAGQPVLSEAEQFNQVCERKEKSKAILGCVNSDGKIYLYNTNSQQLDGVEESTAAHEMLHLAWERLSEAQKTDLTTQLEAAYDQHKNSELEDRLAYYQRTNPDQRVNELHSIIGTEFAELSTELENYYSRYFKDRQKVVQFYEDYRTVFDELEAESNQLKSQIEVMKKDLNQQIAQYNQAVKSLNNSIAAHNEKAVLVDRSVAAAVNQYNQKRQQLLNEVDLVEAQRQTIDRQTKIYNQKIVQYNKLTLRSQQLSDSLDSLAANPAL